MEWDGKNIRENRFVIEYITDRLKALGVTTEVAALETVAYGEIEHLCANISGQASPDDLEKSSMRLTRPLPYVVSRKMKPSAIYCITSCMSVDVTEVSSDFQRHRAMWHSSICVVCNSVTGNSAFSEEEV